MSAEALPRFPTMFVTHGGGPCFFMEWEPADAWDGLRAALESVPMLLPGTPKAIVVITAHWEDRPVAVEAGERPELIYDYHGFPPHTYELTYPAPGDPELGARVRDLLTGSGIAAQLTERGWDHGVFVPLKVAFPGADVPVVAISLQAGLDPDTHLRMGAALAPLRDEGVLILGSGSSFHNLRAVGSRGVAASIEFQDWLHHALTPSGEHRAEALRQWAYAPSGRMAHPREEHLLPVHVVVGAAAHERGREFFDAPVLGNATSCWIFGGGTPA